MISVIFNDVIGKTDKGYDTHRLAYGYSSYPEFDEKMGLMKFRKEQSGTDIFINPHKIAAIEIDELR